MILLLLFGITSSDIPVLFFFDPLILFSLSCGLRIGVVVFRDNWILPQNHNIPLHWNWLFTPTKLNPSNSILPIYGIFISKF
jgi:hypothetical protein